MLSSRQRSINRPNLKIVGLSPSYKWITLHGGYRSYNLHPYLTSGTTVLGGGIELRPGRFYLLSYVGKLANAYNVAPNQLAYVQDENIEFYTRRTWGVKLGFGSSSNYFNISYTKSRDDENAGSAELLKDLSISPLENTGLGASTGLRLLKNISITGNVAIVLQTVDHLYDQDDDESGEDDLPDSNPILCLA